MINLKKQNSKINYKKLHLFFEIELKIYQN